jgi:hypothetical protein
MYPNDDESVLSGIYTESGDSSVIHNTLDPEDDDEAFRRAVQAEQGRVMREFGVLPLNTYNDAISVADETISVDDVKDKTTSTPETYDEVYGVDDEESDGNHDDASTFRPNTLFPSDAEMKDLNNDPILTPRRLKIIMVVLCTIFLGSIAVALGSFLVQQRNESPSQIQVDADADTDIDIDPTVPDTEQLNTDAPEQSPTAPPTGSFNWSDGDCVDHPYKKFKINDQYGEQDCMFLRSNLDQRARMCLSVEEGHRWCPVTCGLCLKNFAPTISPTPIRLSSAPAIAASVTPSVNTESRSTLVPTISPTFPPTLEEVEETEKPTPAPTEEPTPEPTAELTSPPTTHPTIAATMPPTVEETIVSTSAPTSSSFFCRTCPFNICEILPCD